jgi:hypothetical protein
LTITVSRNQSIDHVNHPLVGIVLAMWILFFVFFLAIELFVLVNKFGEKENDYDAIIVHQKNVRIRMIGTLPEDQKF